MPHNNLFGPNLKHDIPAGLVVFLVALPLCLGIALASGAPLISGVIAGVIGGLVVGPLSGSQLSVSGPAAGLTVIVLGAIATLGSFEAFLTAVVLAGCIQIALGYARAGLIGYYFPAAVIKGMLAGIGVILVLKQIPHALGFDQSSMGSVAFGEKHNANTFTELWRALTTAHTGALLIALSSLLILVLWENKKLKQFGVFKFIPGPLVVVVISTLLNELFMAIAPTLALSNVQLVNIPQLFGDEANHVQVGPDWRALGQLATWTLAATMAIVASLESLLSLEASDKLDPYKRNSPPNRELKAQGVGNVLSGLLGGLPITAVIVRSSANVTAGARTRVAAIAHGFFMAGFVLLTPKLLNHIPLAGLASILIFIGYKLSSVSLYRGMYRLGWSQFMPFLITVLAIIFTNLLQGIAIGLVVALFFILRNNYRNAFVLQKGQDKDGGEILTLTLSQEVSYLNKGAIAKCLQEVPANGFVVIDATTSNYIDHDVLEVLQDFKINAPSRNIHLTLINIPDLPFANSAATL
ncbi:MAG: SulP family inorganic anion transporter [Sphingobacteriaceae bacterium]|nr:SulP family inorganic anion transporter [Sphingobacteriaceae bacterium]